MTTFKKKLSFLKEKFLNNKVIKTLLVFIIGIFVLCSALSFTPKKNNPNDSIVQQKQVYVDNTINDYINKLQQEQGYENVTYELSKISIISDEYNIPYRFNGSLENAILNRYDYYADYYKVIVNKTEYMFKTKDTANDFVSKLKKYTGTTYTIQKQKDFISKETPSKNIDAVIAAKEQAYKKAQEEKAKKEAARRAAKAQKKKASTSKKSSQSSTPHVSTNAGVAAYQGYAHNLVINTYGWSEYDYECLVKLWNRESGWNPNAHNKRSGAHGIPQSLPAKKMASEGADYYTNGYTQIRWGLKYIKGRYGSPSAAWAHSQRTGWY